MSNTTLQPVNDPLQAYNKANAAGKKLLESIFGTGAFQNIKNTVTTIEDVYAIVRKKPTAFLPKGVKLEDFIKYPANKIELIAKVLNEGWVPDWSDDDEYKYYPWFEWNDKTKAFSFYVYDCRYTDSFVGSRLCFKSSELAEYAGKQFIKEYNEFLKP